MSTLTSRLSEPPEVSGLRAEGAQLVREAEERLHRINQDSRANEGTRQAAADIVQAMRRVQLLIEAHHDGMGKGMAFSPVVRPAPEKRRWPRMAWVGQFRAAVSQIGDFALTWFLQIAGADPGRAASSRALARYSDRSPGARPPCSVSRSVPLY